jgi:hypothetical protein
LLFQITGKFGMFIEAYKKAVIPWKVFSFIYVQI